MHQSGKYSPTRYIAVVSPLAVALFHTSAVTHVAKESNQIPEKALANIKMRNSKVRAVKAIRKHDPPPSPTMENGHKAPVPVPNPEDNPGAAPRPRKRSFRPPDVRTIFEPIEKDPRVKEEKGEGHTFCPDASPAWCDVCCHTIFQDRLTCTGCKYSCHAECRDRVSLDCNQNGPAPDRPHSPLSQDHFNNNQDTHADVEKSRLRTHFSREEIQNKIQLYNTASQDHLKMTLHSSGLYTGFIKVQLELRRPITVRVAGGAAGPGGVRAGGGGGGEEAFYLPRGSVNTLHVSSTNTVRQVIEALLNKFTVADNPAKFALYKRCKREEQVYICKLSEDEQPLFLRLLAGPNTDTLSFVLREQQTGEVMWDAFSIPELHNFLRILDKEEQDQLRVITHRYDTYKQKLEEALKAVGPG
ncbi:LOW QUALITY PROTEIN: ras association domain-containing protein 5 [Alosa sapidissima]|uniref:LOW QUALITY PROTEIN: ras association domain-containing protein 5 n=1 Tax=Alosa sapidissima TaxID=34773 RepID=UPI001C09FD4B|nr:LOW QUALITY PROTEIN: ras association domain-containing protein 5 [Alosa sapidissima]